jgi:hypothetical protein
MGATRLSLEENLKRAYEKIYTTSQELKVGDLGLFWNSSLDSLMQAVLSKIGKMISADKVQPRNNGYYGYNNNASEFERTFEFLPCTEIPLDGELILAKKDIFYRDRDFSSIVTKAGKTIESLYIKPDGIAFLTLQSFTDTGAVTTRVCSYNSEKEFFLFNLPFFEYSIINNEGEEKTKLEKIVATNPVSIIAKIYQYINKNKAIVERVEKLFQAAEEEYNGEGKTKRNISSCSGSIEGALESFGSELSKGSKGDNERGYWNFSIKKEAEKLIFTNKAKRYFIKPLNSPRYYGNGIESCDYKAFLQPYSFEVKEEGILNVQYVEPNFTYVEPPQGIDPTTVLNLISAIDFRSFMQKNYKAMFKETAEFVIAKIDNGTANNYDRNRDYIKNLLKFSEKEGLVYIPLKKATGLMGNRLEVLKLKANGEGIDILFAFPNKANQQDYTYEEFSAREFLAQFVPKFPMVREAIEVSQTIIVENLKKNIVNANARYRNADASLAQVRELYKPLEEITNFIVGAYKSEIFIKML